jgi:DNA-directed RNA polymerase specialized sigma24 family protein
MPNNSRPDIDMRGHRASRRFKTTQWSVVTAAAAQPSTESRAALSALCHAYWSPIYAYLRSHGYSVVRAEDATQGFFAMLLQANALARADPARGRFRSYVLGALKFFLANERDRECAERRGGDRHHVSLDTTGAENRIALSLSRQASPERLFEREWGLTILDRALVQLRQRYARESKEELLQLLQPYLTRPESQDGYRDAAHRLGMSEGAARVAIHRLRCRYRDLVCQQIAATVSCPAEVHDEICELFRALRG